MKKIALPSFALCLMLAVAGFIFTTKTQADGLSLSIYPPVIEIQTTPPSSPVTQIKIKNNEDSRVDLQIELLPFKPNGATGEIKIENAQNQGLIKLIQEKVQFLVNGVKTSSITLDPLETKTVNLNVNLTKQDPPGDYYYSVIFINNGKSLTDTSSSQIPAGIATNLLISIGPKTPSTGGISEFTTSHFKSKGPVYFLLKLHNASPHLIQPVGKVTIEDLFGKNIGTINILPQYVLANSDRYLTDESQSFSKPSENLTTPLPQLKWNEGFLFGFYKATAQIKLDENSNPITQSIYFLAFPLYFFFVIVIAVFITLSIYLRVKKKI
jgi:hypothetical protein